MKSVTIITEKMVAGGDCIGKSDGKIIFVPDALPEEKLDIYITGQKRDYRWGRIAGIVEPSPRRIDPPCPFYGSCGGCNLQTADYPFQQELKRGIVEDAFNRAGFGKFQRLPPVTVIAGEPWEYRSRFQFHRLRSSRGTELIGLKARAGHQADERIVPVTDCPVAVKQIRELLRPGIGGRADWLMKMQNSESFAFSTTDFKSNRLLKEDRFTVFAGDSLRGEDNRDIVIENNTAPVCRVELLGREIRFDVRGFFQSNLPLMERMIAAVCEGLQGERAADLYSGAGIFALFLQDRFDEIILVEQNRDALGWAEVNLAGKKHTSYGMNCGQWILRPEASERFGAVIADPPRSGLEPEVCRWLCRCGTPELRYVSCDPVTLARDAVKLAQGGFTLRELTIFDFYPQTSHIESLAIFDC